MKYSRDLSKSQKPTTNSQNSEPNGITIGTRPTSLKASKGKLRSNNWLAKRSSEGAKFGGDDGT